MFEIFAIIAIVLAVLTMGGMCFDWSFSGTIDPIYVDGSEPPESKSVESRLPERKPPRIDMSKNMVATCPNCGKSVEISASTFQIYGRVKCGYCRTEIYDFVEKAI